MWILFWASTINAKSKRIENDGHWKTRETPMKIGNPATRSSNEAARIIIGSMDLMVRKEQWRIAKSFSFVKLWDSSQSKVQTKHAKIHQKSRQPSAQISRFQAPDRHPESHIAEAFICPSSPRIGTLPGWVYSKKNIHQETKWKIPIIDSRVQ